MKRAPKTTGPLHGRPGIPRPKAGSGKVEHRVAGARKIGTHKETYGQNAKKPQDDDRPLKHGSVQKKHKRRQRLEQKLI